jgi:hypothetical protein
MRRAAPNGTVLRWRLTLNAVPGSLIPFLISWGAALLTALGADVEIKPAATAAFAARLSGPNGSRVLR